MFHPIKYNASAGIETSKIWTMSFHRDATSMAGTLPVPRNFRSFLFSFLNCINSSNSKTLPNKIISNKKFILSIKSILLSDEIICFD